MTRATKVAGLAIVALVGTQACTEESITSVDISQVSVTPPAISTLEGERVQFAATVRGDGDEVLDAAEVTWSSEDERVVMIDEAGVARALGPGTARVYASFRGVTGEARVSVSDLGGGGGPGPGGGGGGKRGDGEGDDETGLLDVLLDPLLGG